MGRPFTHTNFMNTEGTTMTTTSKYASKAFWVDTFDRAIATFAQSLAGVLAVDKIGILDVDWQGALSMAAAVTAASVLTSVSFRGNQKQ